jgi:CBS domain-containing protein
MRQTILSCASDAPLREVAAIMARNRVHCVAVLGDRGERPIGIVSALDLVAAAASGTAPTAVEMAAPEPPSVSADAPLQLAAQRMTDNRVTHLVVLDGASGYPIGILSTLDVAAAYVRDSNR